LTTRYNSITGEAWCVDVLSNVVYYSPAITELVKTIDNIILDDFLPFGAVQVGYRDDLADSVMSDTVFGNKAITAIFIAYNTSNPADSSIQIHINDDTLTSSYITSIEAQGVGTFDQLTVFDASGGSASWTFQANPNTLGVGDWAVNESRTVTLKLV
jgi:hypothetical protein